VIEIVWEPTVKVPLRDEDPVFAATEYPTLPLPLPLDPLVIVSHDVLLLTAVHVQPVPAVTETVPVPADGVKVCDVGEAVTVQAAPACVTDTVCPAIVTLALRGVVKVLAVAVSVTVPFPAPVAPPVMLSQPTLSLAVHAQPAPAATAADIVPPAAGTDRLVGVTP
jgi:hypothetical protein